MEFIDISYEKVSDIKQDASTLKQLKQLCRKVTGEQLKIFDDDIVIIAKYGKKIVGMCNIAFKSPESHFENEVNNKVAYLYNYMCDITQKAKKPSVVLMNFIKDYVMTNVDCKDINLDVEIDNIHAQQFFEKNNFIQVGKYARSKEYFMYTYTILITID